MIAKTNVTASDVAKELEPILGAMVFRGTWDAANNIPDLSALTPANGDYYIVGTAGNTVLGGVNEWKQKDWASYNAVVGWQKIDNTDAVTSVAGRQGDVVLSKNDVGLANVDDTSDLNKPISTAAQAALNTKYDATNPANFINAGQAPVQSVAGKTGAVALNKTDVGLQNVDNTSDANKPISTAVNNALNTKENISQKGTPNGYAGLDNNGWVIQPATQVRAVAPTTNSGAVGVDAGKLKFGDGAQIRTVEQTDQKGAPNGYAALDNNSRVIQPATSVQNVGPTVSNGAIGVNGGQLQFGDGAQVRTTERVDMKGAPNGYAALDNNSRVMQPVTSIQNIAPATTAGSVGMNAGKLQFGDGAQVRTAEQTDMKNANNGYAGLDNNGKLNAGQIPGLVLTGFTAVRKIGSGTTNVAGGATVDLAVFTRNANELLQVFTWVQQNAVITFAEDRAGLLVGLSEGVSFFFERTANAGEVKLRAKNSNATTARDVEWCVMGLVP